MYQQIFSYINVVTNLLLLILLVFYFFYLRLKERALNKKENLLDTNYHKIIDDTLARERKIIDDTTKEASQIIGEAQFVNKETKDAVNQALEKMVSNLHQGTLQTSKDFIKYYLNTLGNLTQKSLNDFQTISKQMEIDLQNQVKQFQSSLGPSLEKELEAYKAYRLKQTEASIQKIIQKVSEEVLNRSISIEDHQKLVLESLEKAKVSGIFD